MRIAFLLHELGRAGGMGVVAGYARRLAERPGWDAEIVLTRGRGRGRTSGPAPVLSLDEARGNSYDVALATWWETAPALWELDCGTRAVFLQSLEERFYGPEELWERLGAA